MPYLSSEACMRRRMRHATFLMVKATVERKSMREVLFEGLKWYVTPAEIPTTPQKKGKKKA